MDKQELREGMVVQLSPDTVGNKMFAGCFMTVTEPKPWGAQGYVQGLGVDGEPAGQAYYRAKWEEMELVGETMWLVMDAMNVEYNDSDRE